MSELLRPNGEQGTKACFKCQRMGLPTASLAVDSSQCMYHEYASRWGVTKVYEEIAQERLVSPFVYAKQQTTNSKRKA